MTTLQDALKNHLERSGRSVRFLAKKTGIGYQILLGVVNRGSLPRRADHRERLRELLGFDERSWAELILSSAAADLPVDEATPSLQRLVTREMYARGLTEQTLAATAGVAYSTVMGITRKGAVPREDSLRKLRDSLQISEDDMAKATAVSRASRRVPRGHEDDDRSLPQMVVDMIQHAERSIASFAQEIGLGYLATVRFLDQGEIPQDEAVLGAIRKALGLDEAAFATARKRPATPAQFATRDHLLGIDPNPLQKAMVAYMRSHNLTLKALAKRADLSQVTVSRLVKQGQAPTRATTHLKLQELLSIPPDEYQVMLAQIPHDESGALTARAADEDDEDHLDEDDDEDDEYSPDDPGAAVPAKVHELREAGSRQGSKKPATEGKSPDDLASLVRRMGPQQRDNLKKILSDLL